MTRSPSRLVCVHGHFYQPPRENPWTGRVEREPSAAPFHDWNGRITAECYEPCTRAEILDAEGRVVERFDVYRHISFNFGPTLLDWLARKAPGVHRAVVAADRAGCERFDGHGPALAQAYGHMILPLADERDKRTQVRWGIADFEHRFGRRPEGLWLPETAVDVETLEALAHEDLRFTLLAPAQARRVRRLGAGGEAGEGAWTDVSGGRVDPTVPYRVGLPSGRSVAVFFYDGELAQAVAFGGLLHDGDRFAETLLNRAAAAGMADGKSGESEDSPRLVHLATDGETYGHHHRHGEMALAWALRRLEREGAQRGDVDLTTYGRFLALRPPEHEVELVSPSSWSCPHGVDRWARDCGCRTGGEPGWSQGWRGPLRRAFDRLRDAVDPRFETEMGRLVEDPWDARDAYVQVMVDSAPPSRRRFLEEHRLRDLTGSEEERLWTLLELQRLRQSMYTSCGWFFSDPAGLETVQVLCYAARAAELADSLWGSGLQARLVEDLRAVQSNRPAEGDGAAFWRRHVEPHLR